MNPGLDAAPVVLVHGLFMRPWCLAPLRWRLQRAGLGTVSFSYATRTQPLAASVAALHDLVRRQGPGSVHFIAHSMGGLLLQHLFATHPDLPAGRCVTLGSPHLGSGVAAALARYRRFRRLLGQSLDYGLLGDAPPWDARRELGVIAGVVPVGLGRLLPGCGLPGDGTVAVAETALPGRRARLCLPVTHFGMLLSARVAAECVSFIRRGHWLKQD